MNAMIRSGILGAVAIGATIALPKPASAEIFVNFKGSLASTSECIGVSGGVDLNENLKGTSIITWNCTGSEDQSWTENTFNGFTQLQDFAKLSGHPACLADPGANGSDSGVQLTVAVCNSLVATQEFVLRDQNFTDPTGGECFKIQNLRTGNVVGVANGSDSRTKIVDGMRIIMWPDNGSNDQIWCKHPDPIQPPH